MNLQLEYYLRNDIGAPFLSRRDAGVLLYNPLNEDVGDSYLYFSINFSNRSGEDGQYIGRFDVTTQRPERLSSCVDILEQKVVYWSDYHQCVLEELSCLKKKGWKALTKETDVHLAAWDIFCYCCDVRLGYLPVENLVNIAESLDKSNPSRMTLINNIVDFFIVQGEVCTPYRTLHDMWVSISEVIFRFPAASWLSDFFNKSTVMI